MQVTAPFKIADHLVEPDTLRVIEGDRKVRLESKAMQVLVYLAERAGQAVSRSELEDQIWPDTYVTEDAITNAIAKARRALGDDARNPRFIETIPKVGYRVIAEVESAAEFQPTRVGAQNALELSAPTDERHPANSVDGSSAFGLSAGRLWRALVVATLSVVAIWHAYDAFWPRKTDVAETKRPAIPARASIAVLPFKYIGGDGTHDYLSDGITEDIITDLSKFSELFVIASNTAFTFKGKAVNIHSVSRQLGVRYLLGGSVQLRGRQARVNAKLIDTTTGQHVWADRLEGKASDLIAFQDEIVGTIVSTLASKVGLAERNRALRKPPANFEAYDYVLRGRAFRGHSTRTANAQARDMFRRASELDPLYAAAHAGLGWCYVDAFLWGWTENPGEALRQAQELARKALSLDERSGSARRLLAFTYLKWQRYDLAITEYRRALERNPNDADSQQGLGGALLYSGRHHTALSALETARRFNPHLQPAGLVDLGLAYFLKGRYDDAIAVLELALARNSKLVAVQAVLAAAYASANRMDDAERSVANVRRLHPFFKVDAFGSAFRLPDDRASLRSGLRKAGLK